MLLQFAQMGAAYSTEALRRGPAPGGAAVHRRGEVEGHAAGEGDPRPAGRGRPTATSSSSATSRVATSSSDEADVIVTDGFTGNVALKTLEGTLRFLIGALTGIFARPEVADAAGVLFPHLLPLAATLDPENTGGAMLLGVDGVCVISHGSSSSVAMVNAITVAHDVAVDGLVDAVAASVHPDRPRPTRLRSVPGEAGQGAGRCPG